MLLLEYEQPCKLRVSLRVLVSRFVFPSAIFLKDPWLNDLVLAAPTAPPAVCFAATELLLLKCGRLPAIRDEAANAHHGEHGGGDPGC